MIVREKEAGGYRCCGPMGCGTVKSGPFDSRFCIGSRCMAWRWVDGENIPAKTYGYCGLAPWKESE